MTRRVWQWLGLGILGLILYLSFMIVFAPAYHFARFVAMLSHNTIALQQPNGTLWRGSGTLVLNHQTGPQPLGQIQWAVHPWHLLAGSVVADLELAGEEAEIRGMTSVGFNHYTLRNVSGFAPVRMVTLMYPMTAAFGPTGRVRLNISTLELRKNELRGSADLIWEGAASQLLPVTQTSDYKLHMNGQGKHAIFRIETLQGILQVTADGEWRIFGDGMLRVQGTVAPTTPQPALDPILNNLGPPQLDGRRAFSFETRLTFGGSPAPVP